MKERYPPMKDIKKASKKVNNVFSGKKGQKKEVPLRAAAKMKIPIEKLD